MKNFDYRKKFGRDMDFLVKYSRIPESRLLIPKFFQGMRFDYAYKSTEAYKNYMIWPEFIHKDGTVIDDDVEEIPDEGLAGMWILDSDMIQLHKNKLEIDKYGYFTIGQKRIANTELIYWKTQRDKMRHL